MNHQFLVLGAAVVAASAVPVPAARSESSDTCLSRNVNVSGTRGSDVIRVYADEVGGSVWLNGKSFRVRGPVSIDSGAGHDKVEFHSDGGGDGVVCSGSGDDRISGNGFSRIHTETATTRSSCTCKAAGPLRSFEPNGSASPATTTTTTRRLAPKSQRLTHRRYCRATDEFPPGEGAVKREVLLSRAGRRGKHICSKT